MLVFSKIKTVSSIVIAWVVYFLSYLILRDKKIWVVMGWRKDKNRELFGDNAKYFFLYATQNLKKQGIRVIWMGKDDLICRVLRDRGYEAYNIDTFKGAWFSLRAFYTIIDANFLLKNWQYSGGTRVIQLWHGKSVKKMGFNSPYGLGRYKKKLIAPNLFCKFYCLIAASKLLGNFLVSGFKIKEDDLVITGLPRYDALFNDIENADIDIDKVLSQKLSDCKSANYEKIVLYAPTFRPDGTNPISVVNFEDLNKVLARKNYYCLVSLHPKFATKSWQPQEKYSHIDFVASGFDLYPLLNQFDLLITDYSSLALDFLLVKVPAIMFVYDLEKYKKAMGIHEELWDLMPGPRVTSFAELLAIIDNNDSYQWSDKHTIARDTFFSFQDANSAQRVVKLLLEFMDVPGKDISESKTHLQINKG